MAELPEGYRYIPEEDRKKAAQFFERGSTVAGTGNYDYAIEMYLQGLNIDPEAIDAHQALRDISFKRKASGGKALGMLAAMKLRGGKDDKENLLNAEKLLAYDPGNTDHMLRMVESARQGGFYDTVLWIGAILLKANADSPKPDFSKYIKLKDAYAKLGRWDKANEAMKYAVAMRPDDSDLVREARDIAATDAMKRGGYDKGGSFRDSVRDMDKQKELMTQDTDVRTMDVLGRQIQVAEEEWKADPKDFAKLGKLVDVLEKTDNPDHENKAIEYLESAFEQTRQYRFRFRASQIKLRQLTRMERSLRAQIASNPNDADLKKTYSDFIADKLKQELDIFQEASQNYPTDMSLRFNTAERMFQLGMYGEAIPIFQQARNDPKYRVAATVGLGRAFLDAGFEDEAIDTLKELIESYEVKSDNRFTEMSYWYGRALEKKGDVQAALKAYSAVAMANFNYRDVQARIKRLRSNPSGPTAA